MTRVIVSGGFDPIHVGHCRYFNNAKALGTYLIVIVNTDEFLMKKKGFVFMPQAERIEVISNLFPVNEIITCIDTDMRVSETLKMIKQKYPTDTLIFAKGGDRNIDNVPEVTVCKDIGIHVEFGIGGDKIQSSSDLARRLKNG